ncbi:hypothetical protein [Actinophytocola algeriensis]|uniref:Uncharacterized protein n=1 Tax=Actinophytocola algeriensis TaxID=1768010 RepID=A0A7W7VFV7_9PSEU|nr:hypothetical protein [Actinophytocola algeriensis]MBB4908787.1 hypothetical protein [Actinophytocola algeriensis]MBE1474826.1 hypothetical protein [Actinophytocola algeriensis]
MFRRVTGIVVVTAAALLGGCGRDSGDSGGATTTAGPEATVADGPLAGLDGDKLCGMVDVALLEEHFGEPFADALGGVNPPEQDGSVVCTYPSQAFVDAEIADLANKLQVTTTVTHVTDASTAQDALDASLADDGKTLAYQPVDGLGAVAGYAGSDLNVDSGGSHLVAVIAIDGAFVEVVTQADPEGTVEQLRPIADELLTKVESEPR